MELFIMKIFPRPHVKFSDLNSMLKEKFNKEFDIDEFQVWFNEDAVGQDFIPIYRPNELTEYSEDFPLVKDYLEFIFSQIQPQINELIVDMWG